MNASNPLKINRSGGFSLVELLTVITIIVILAGLTVGTMGWVQGKAAADKGITVSTAGRIFRRF